MKMWMQCLAAGLLVLMGQVAIASPSQPIEWSDLPDPSVQVFEDPFRDLNPEQFDDLVFAVRLRARLQQDVGSAEERQKWKELLVETEEALDADGIDIDWLLSQREAVIHRRETAHSSGNPIYDGQTITIAGYAIPAPPDADGHSVAYLVPEPGMCSHLPPPPPNQMVRVVLSENWAPEYVHEPVRLTGTLSIDPSEHRMVVVDGMMPMRATFLLNAHHIETFEQDENQRRDLQSLIDRIRAGAHQNTGGAQVQN